MQVDAGELIEMLRERMALKVDDKEEFDVMAAFDRSCVQTLVAIHNGQNKAVELTSGQKAAITRKANRLARQQEETEQDAGGSPTTVGGK